MTDLDIAAYLDRGLSVAERTRVEDHLAQCPECRQQLAETHQILKRAARPRRLFAAAAILAAGVAFVLVVKPGQLQQYRATTLERGGTSEPTLIAYGPTGEVNRAQLRFVWGAAPNAASYRLTVSGADGTPVWSTSTGDTVATAPGTVLFAAGNKYFWVADAIATDGTTRSTGLREFKPVP
jgi:putative zinc finger protein